MSKVLKNGEVVQYKTAFLRVEYTFHDGGSDETLTLEGIGEIDQDGGKGIYKAQTGAMKYALMKNFLVATGDDPEQTPAKAEPKPIAAPSPAPSPKAPPKRAAIKEPPPASQIIGLLKKQTLLQPLKVVYDKAFTHPWSPEDEKAISECFLEVYGKLSNWHRDGDVFVSGTGDVHGKIVTDPKTGKVTVVEVLPQPPVEEPKPEPAQVPKGESTPSSSTFHSIMSGKSAA